MLLFVLGIVFAVICLVIAYWGIQAVRSNTLPNGEHTIGYKDFKITVQSAGMFLVLIGVAGAMIFAFSVIAPHKPDTSPRARPVVGPAAARDVQPTGPWQGEANGVRLEVTTVTYGEDHLPQVRFRLTNTSKAEVIGDIDWFSVVDNFGRARSPDAGASSLSEPSAEENDGLAVDLAPGEVVYGRMQIELPWDVTTERFDARANVHYLLRPMRFDVVTPGIAVPANQRVGG